MVEVIELLVSFVNLRGNLLQKQQVLVRDLECYLLKFDLRFVIGKDLVLLPPILKKLGEMGFRIKRLDYLSLWYFVERVLLKLRDLTEIGTKPFGTEPNPGGMNLGRLLRWCLFDIYFRDPIPKHRFNLLDALSLEFELNTSR